MESSTNQLLNFVSNASKELKDMIGKVDRDEKVEVNMSMLSPSQSLPRLNTPMSSPVPSPTPSCVSSISDQEVPSMSPRFFAKNNQRSVHRKRSQDSMSDFLDVPTKFRRADSVGEYDGYYPGCAMTISQRPRIPESPPALNDCNLLQDLYEKSYHNVPKCEQFSTPQHHQQSQLRTSQRPYAVYNDYTPGFGNRTNNHGVNGMTFAPMRTYNTQQYEQVPDFADLVSWMLAEDFLDAESLSALLLRC